MPDVDRHEVTSSFLCKLDCSTFVKKGDLFHQGLIKPREKSFVPAFIHRKQEHFFRVVRLGMLKEEKTLTILYRGANYATLTSSFEMLAFAVFPWTMVIASLEIYLER